MDIFKPGTYDYDDIYQEFYHYPLKLMYRYNYSAELEIKILLAKKTF